MSTDRCTLLLVSFSILISVQQNVKVRTKRLQDQVYNGRLYHYTTKRFKRRMDNEVKKAKELAKMGAS